MDFLLIVVSILGFVVAVVMLVLAARARRESVESQERAETLEALATGSVLFAHAATTEPLIDEWEEDDAQFDAPIAQPAIPESPRFTVLEPAPVPPVPRPPVENLDLALSEFANEDEEEDEAEVRGSYVMTIPVAAGVGRVQVSFDRSRRRSHS